MGGRPSRARSYGNPALQELRNQREQKMNENRKQIKLQQKQKQLQSNPNQYRPIENSEPSGDAFQFQRVASKKLRKNAADSSSQLSSAKIMALIREQEQREKEEQMAYEQRYRNLSQQSGVSDFDDYKQNNENEIKDDDDELNSKTENEKQNYDEYHHHFYEMDTSLGTDPMPTSSSKEKEKEMEEKLKRVGTKKSKTSETNPGSFNFNKDISNQNLNNNSSSSSDVSVNDIMQQMESERPTNTYVSTINAMADNIVRTHSLEGIVGRRHVKHPLPGHFDVSDEDPASKPTNPRSSSSSSSSSFSDYNNNNNMTRSIPGTIREEDLQYVYNTVRRGQDARSVLLDRYGMNEDQCDVILGFYNNYVVIEGTDQRHHGLWTTPLAQQPNQGSSEVETLESKHQEQNE